MNIFYVDDAKRSERYAEYVRFLVNECSHEFFPPLNARKGTTDTDLKAHATLQVAGVDAYVNGLLGQANIFATNGNGEAIGFMSFIHNRSGEPIFDDLRFGINNYISTICVLLPYRRMGIGKLLYEFIEEGLPSEVSSDFISTRTWNDNKNHIFLLEKRGYECVHSLENDREHDGVVKSSVYFAKKLNKVG